MALDTTTLDQQLGDLQQQTQQVLQLKHKTRKQERTHIANVYVWWRTAREQGTYLEDKYAELAIPNNKLKGKINFRPFLTLVTGGSVNDNDLNLWQITLNAVHTDWEDKPQHYASDTIDRIVNFIDEQGGKTGIAKYHVAEAEELFVDDVVEDEQIKHWLDMPDESQVSEAFLAQAKDHYGKSTGAISVGLPQVQDTPDGYSVVIVRKNGEVSDVLGAVNNKKLIGEMLTSMYRNNFNVMPMSMRAVLEPLHVLNVPSIIADSADKFIESSRVKHALIDDKKVAAVKRLTYRKDNKDFLLSNVCVDAGVVIQAKPRVDLFGDVQGDLCLSNTLRKSIETRLLYPTMFNMFTTPVEDKFVANPEGSMYAYKLPLQCRLLVEGEYHAGMDGSDEAQQQINLSHPPIDWMPFYTDAPQLNWQVDMADEPFVATWTGHASSYWIRNTVCEFFDEWIAAYAKKSNRPVNKTLLLNLLEQSFVVGYELGKAGYPEVNDKWFRFENGQGIADVQVRSTDFAFAMRQISDLSLTNGVDIAVNAHAVQLTFQTLTHSYICRIPTCNGKGTRDKSLFKRYMPSQTQLHREYGDDDPTINFTDEEVTLLREQGKLV